MHAALRKDIDWVGFVDWNVRDFHGYRTARGSTYNAYLVRDARTALIDTVKAPYVQDLLANVGELAEPSKIDYMVCNHAEPDHAGGFPEVLRACPNAQVVCDQKCRDALAMYFDTTGWKFKVVADGETLSLGARTLKFIETPMVHWPESMFTYVPEERLLFSMDAFGQHLASSARFDDETPLDVILDEARTYYANILMLYGPPIARAMEKVAPLAVEMIAPSHGVIWRKNLSTILSAYRDWVVLKPKAKVLVLYDTMWKSTEKMARAIEAGATGHGAEVKLIWVRASDGTEIATEVLDAACLAFGSPTLNNTLMPQAAGVLTYLKGLKPHGKAALAFGSYGWAPAGPKEVDQYLRAMKFDILREPVVSQYAPSGEVLGQCREAGRQLAEKALELAGR